MRARLVFLFAVVVFVAVAGAAGADYWTWTHSFLVTNKNTKTGVGFYPSDAPGMGAMNPALYGDYGQQNTIQFSPADNSQAQTFLSIKNAGSVLIRPDGFSFNNDINAWLADPEHALLYSVAQNYRFVPVGASYYSENLDDHTNHITTTTTLAGPGLDLGNYTQNLGRVIDNPAAPPPYLQTYIPNVLGSQFTNNDDISIISNTGYEALVKHAERQDGAYQTLGVFDETWFTGAAGSSQAGRLGSSKEYALGDFQPTESAPDPLERIYFSAGRYVVPQLMSGRITGYRPVASWPGGSDYSGRANAGDVLTQYIDVTYPDPEYPEEPLYTLMPSVFEKAYKIAGCMVGDQFWTVAGGSLRWNTWFGYVSTSTASNAPESVGHEVVKNFMRYVFDITAMKVQDYDGDGVFDLGQDLILFSVMSDRACDQMTTWTDTTGSSWPSPAYFAGQFFDGDTIFLYDGYSVVTYMDRDSNLFYGQPISTGNATIWGEKWGEYDLTGFALTYNVVPEPGTIFMVVTALVGITAAMRRVRRK